MNINKFHRFLIDFHIHMYKINMYKRKSIFYYFLRVYACFYCLTYNQGHLESIQGRKFALKGLLCLKINKSKLNHTPVGPLRYKLLLGISWGLNPILIGKTAGMFQFDTHPTGMGLKGMRGFVIGIQYIESLVSLGTYSKTKLLFD